MKKFNCFLILAWFLIVVICAFNHEIWRDEAQVWCIVRDLNIVDAFNVARSEGHPFLWYLFVMPFAKLGLPVESMQALGLISVFASIVFFVLKSPFDNFQKTVVVFSAGMMYYLPVVVRNYALIPIFIFLLAYFYNKKSEKPILYLLLLILLSHTHIYMLGFVGILFLLFVWELIQKNKKAVLLPSLFGVINFVIIFLLFNNTQNENYALESGIKASLSFGVVLSLISKMLFYNLARFSNFAINHFNILSIILFYPALSVFFIALMKKHKQLAIIFIVAVGFILFLFTKVYFNGILYQKIFLIYLIMIFCFWIADNKDKFLNYSFLSLFIISMLITPVVILDEVKQNFSGGKQVANYIKTNLKDEATFIAVGNPFLFSTVSAYLPNKKFYNVLAENYITYSTYKKLALNKKEQFPQNAEFNIVVEKSDLNDNPYFDFVFASDDSNLSSKTEREIFKIYKRKKL